MADPVQTFEVTIAPFDPQNPTTFSADLFQVTDTDGSTGDLITSGTGSSPLAALADLVQMLSDTYGEGRFDEAADSP